MSRLLKSQNYLMKCLGFVLLFGFISLGAIGGCSNNDSGDTETSRPDDIHDLAPGEIDIEVSGRGFTINGQPFTVKGVNYSPIPIGTSFDDGDKIGDVFFDYFNPIHEVDIKLMKEMGVNTIRIYGMFPWHPQNGPADPNNPVADRDHTNFLDMLYDNGICVFITYPIGDEAFKYKVVDQEPTDGSFFVVLPTGSGGTNEIWVEDEQSMSAGFNWLGQQTAAERRQSDKEAYLALADKYKNHPAVFGWVLTNEKNSPQSRVNPNFWSYLNELAGELKVIAPKKETMITLIDDGMLTLEKVEENNFDVKNIDIWGINSYRGNTNEATNNFDNLFSSFHAVSDKPLIVTEFGPPSSTRTEIINAIGVPITPGDTSQLGFCSTGTFTEFDNTAQMSVSDYLEGHWNDIVANSDVAAGGIVFSWVDEWWKSGNKNVLNKSPGDNANFPGGCADEEAFGINSIVLKRGSPSDFPSPFVPDERVPRDQFFTLKQLWTGN